MADIAQCVTSTQSTTQRQSIHTPTATAGTSSHNTVAPGETSEEDLTRHVVSSLASPIASTPTPLSGLESLPTPIPNPEAPTIITNPLQTRATAKNQRQRQWQLQLQVVSTTQSVVSSSRRILRLGHSDMTRLVFGTGRLIELDMWNRRPCLSASDLETGSYSMRRVAKVFT